MFRFIVCLLMLPVLARPVAAGPALLFEASTGQILYAEDQDDQWHPASLTKVMTAYVVFAAIKAGKVTLESKIVCSEAAHKQEPSKIGLPVGADMSLELGLQALIVKSANDVAVMLAETVGGSEVAFVAEMNATAARLGMTRTTFVNPNGLPAPGQVTTARDLAKLAQAVVRDFPEHAHYWAKSDMRIGKRRLGSHNTLLTSFEGADGLKTGFICDSGFNVIASATRDGRRLMAVVLGEPTGLDRKVRAASLLDHGFEVFAWKQLFSPDRLETLAIATDAKAAVTMRQQVRSWACGTGPPKASKGRKGKRKSKKPAGKKAAGDGAPASKTEPAPVTPAAAAAAAKKAK